MLEIGLMIGFFGFAWAEKITKEVPGVFHLRHLLQLFFTFCIKNNSVRMWFEKPLYLCSGCVAGQTAFWVAITRNYDLISVVLLVGVSVTTAMVLQRHVKN